MKVFWRETNNFYGFKTISKPKVHSQITYNSNMVTELKLSDMTHSLYFKINVYFSLNERTVIKEQQKNSLKYFYLEITIIIFSS